MFTVESGDRTIAHTGKVVHCCLSSCRSYQFSGSEAFPALCVSVCCALQAILKDYVTREATSSNLAINIKTDISGDGVEHFLRMVGEDKHPLFISTPCDTHATSFALLLQMLKGCRHLEESSCKRKWTTANI